MPSRIERQYMRQILYRSLSAVPGDRSDLAHILEQSRHNNAIDGVTGMLWSGERAFLQVLEGHGESVEATFARILADPRHHSLEVLSDKLIETREFGYWSMVHPLAGDPPDTYDRKILRLIADKSELVRDQFLAAIMSESRIEAPST